jgi:hypothetical protein
MRCLKTASQAQALRLDPALSYVLVDRKLAAGLELLVERETAHEAGHDPGDQTYELFVQEIAPAADPVSAIATSPEETATITAPLGKSVAADVLELDCCRFRFDKLPK